MHDPLTVAFEIKSPFKNKKTISTFWPNGYRQTLVTIWHKDPCKKGDDDSCDWFGQRRKLNPKEKEVRNSINDLLHTLGNKPYYPELYPKEELERVEKAVYEWRQRSKLRIPVRWHIWHWRIQIPLFQQLWRYWFSRCAICKGRFKWREEVIGNWAGTKIWHDKCDHVNYIPRREENEPERTC